MSGLYVHQSGSFPSNLRFSFPIKGYFYENIGWWLYNQLSSAHGLTVCYLMSFDWQFGCYHTISSFTVKCLLYVITQCPMIPLYTSHCEIRDKQIVCVPKRKNTGTSGPSTCMLVCMNYFVFGNLRPIYEPLVGSLVRTVHLWQNKHVQCSVTLNWPLVRQ